MRAPRARITLGTLDGEEILQVQFPYDARLKDELKAVVPSESRSWDPDRKQWVIGGEYFVDVMLLLEQYVDEVVVDES